MSQLNPMSTETPAALLGIDSGNPLIFEDDRDTIEATRDYLAELVRLGGLDAAVPRGCILSLQVAQRALDHLAKKNASTIVNG